MRVSCTESESQVDDVGGGDPLGSRQSRLVRDGVEDPVADLSRAWALGRRGRRWSFVLAEPARGYGCLSLLQDKSRRGKRWARVR